MKVEFSNVTLAGIVFLSFWSNHSTGAIRFTDVTPLAGIDHSGPSYGASWGDLNGDGLPDLWVGNHYTPPSLYKNNGDGTFTDVIGNVGTGQVKRHRHGAAWADFDRDGDQDLIQLVGGGELSINFMSMSLVFLLIKQKNLELGELEQDLVTLSGLIGIMMVF